MREARCVDITDIAYESSPAHALPVVLPPHFAFCPSHLLQIALESKRGERASSELLHHEARKRGVKRRAWRCASAGSAILRSGRAEQHMHAQGLGALPF